jgi:hypothetical protein
MPSGLLYVEQHILQRNILHSHAPFVQESHPLDSLFDEELCMCFVEAMRLLLQSL